MPALLLSAADVRRLLTPDDAITAVEAAMRDAALGHAPPASVVGHYVPGGGFHVKAASWRRSRHYFAAKTNANFFDNPAKGLPRIQGVIALMDADDGRLLALMDSADITVLRTAAATAVAAKWLARTDATSIAIIGCGLQGRAHAHALSRVRRISRISAFDPDATAASTFASHVTRELGVSVELARDVASAARDAEMVVTCTPSREPILFARDVVRGAFAAGVGADSELKQELDASLFIGATVVTDSTAQCAAFGDLHHAIEAGVISMSGVQAELGQVIAGTRAGRASDTAVIVFDSTGVALQDVASAAIVYERAITSRAGTAFAFA